MVSLCCRMGRETEQQRPLQRLLLQSRNKTNGYPKKHPLHDTETIYNSPDGDKLKVVKKSDVLATL